MKQQRHLLWLALGIWLLLLLPVTQAAPAEDFTKVTLKNGMVLRYKVMKDKPLVSIYAFFPVGMNQEKEKGIAHLLEHLVFRGGSGYSFQDIADNTSRQGGYFNGFTSFTATAYNYVVPKENFEHALKIFNGSIWKTDFTESTVALERKIVLQELDLDYSQRYQYYPIFRYFYPEFRYSKATVEAITTQNLLEFHQRYYQPGNATYVLAGDFDPKQLIGALEKLSNGYGATQTSPVSLQEFSLPQQDVVESRNLYPYQFQVMMSYEFASLKPEERLLLKFLSYIYGYDSKIDYQRNEYKVYNAITRSVGKKDYFGIYYLERNHPYSDEAFNQEKLNIQKFFRQFEQLDFNKEMRNFIQEIKLEIASSQQSPADAVEYEVQRLINPDNITTDALPILKKLTAKDLKRLLETRFSQSPTSWVLVKTTR